MSAKEKIIERLQNSPMPLATHELHIDGYSENNIATRCAELVREKKIAGQYRKGANFKEWFIPKEDFFQ